uniref:Restriction modification system DNA specificity domain protein n=1 Tax=Ectopseudomonas mendocina (strain ymp) TaxID=399739 RepID=A4XPR8_ECTM1
MSDWAESSLEQLVTFQKGRKVDTSSFAQDGFAPYLGASGIEGGDDGYAATQFAVMSKPTDILMLWDGERSGLVGYGKTGVVASTVSKLSPNDAINPKYLFFALSDRFAWIQHRRTGTGVPHVPKDLGRILRLRYPSDPRLQIKIASIFEATDTLIQKSEALIAKYQQIKAGMMHDLFTRGVLPNGQLRPPRSEAPELYQDTSIGWIPSMWKLKRCADICTRICVGIVIQPTQYYVESGVPAFRSANIREDGIDPSNLVFISHASNEVVAKSQVKAGDILSVRTGYPGTSAVVPVHFDRANCIDILISTPSAQVISEYLCDWINSPFGKEQVLRQQGGMAQQHFNVGEMRELLVALPSREEQGDIRNRIGVVAKKLAAEKALLEKLQYQKLGLMHDLLTGKVSVRVDNPASELANA